MHDESPRNKLWVIVLIALVLLLVAFLIYGSYLAEGFSAPPGLDFPDGGAA
jgi:hypothetical protein